MKKTKRLLTIVLSLIMLVCMLPINILTVSATTYNASNAVSYANSHWNDGVGACATFVSNCIEAGGCSAWNSVVSGLRKELLDGNWGTEYKLTKDSYYIYQSKNSGKISAGDPVFMYCTSCKNWMHVYMATGVDSSGRVIGCAHNGAWNGTLGGYKDQYGHTGSTIVAYSIHMDNSTSSNPTVSFKPWSDSQYTFIKNTNAAIGQEITVSGGTCTETGMYLYDSNSEFIASGKNDFYRVPQNYFDINDELGVTLKHATKYYYEFYAVVDGKKYWSEMQSFTTTGSHSYSTTAYESTHPHKEYKKCSCGDFYYTGETKTLSDCSSCINESLYFDIVAEKFRLFLSDHTSWSLAVETNFPEETKILWESDNPAVVSVTDGCVVGNLLGTAKITAFINTVDGKYVLDTCTVEVVSIDRIAIDQLPNKTNYYVGDKFESEGLVLSLYHSDGTIEKTSVIGWITGFDSTTPGTKTVTVTYWDYTTTFTVEVKKPTILLEDKKITLNAADDPTIKVVFSCETDVPEGTQIIWSSDNEAVATVADGILTAKALGKATITASFTVNGIQYSNTCIITTIEITGISIERMPYKTTYYIGDAFKKMVY